MRVKDRTGFWVDVGHSSGSGVTVIVGNSVGSHQRAVIGIAEAKLLRRALARIIREQEAEHAEKGAT